MEGAAKRRERLNLLFHHVHLAMPEGIERPELLRWYEAETGLSAKKAEEHLGLLEECDYVLWNDLRLFTTERGLRWAGFKRDNSGELLDASERAEAKYRECTNANAQKAGSDDPPRKNSKPS